MGDVIVFKPTDEQKMVLINWLKECDSHGYTLEDTIEVMSGPNFEIVDAGLSEVRTNVKREIA